MNKNVFLKSMLPTPGASISIVSELVDMEAMEAIGQTSELTSHLHWPTGDKNIFNQKPTIKDIKNISSLVIYHQLPPTKNWG